MIVLKKKIFVSLFIISLFAFVVFSYNKFYSNKDSIVEGIIIDNTLITMMYETSYGSAQYEISKSKSWPSSGYIYNSDLSYCENDTEIVYDEDTNKINFSGTKSDKCYIYFDKVVTYFANYVKSMYGTDTNLLFHDGSIAHDASDDSYRYAGTNPNNYVCFGSDAETCPEENIYRIIGVFEEGVKLIKAKEATITQLGTDGDYAGNSNNYWWNSATMNNEWSESVLNTINLNTNYINYLNNIDSKWVSMIADSSWVIVKLSEDAALENAYSLFHEEIAMYKDNADYIYTDLIGLMYASDYLYAASSNYWSLSALDYRSAADYNWMEIGLNEWTITASAMYENDVYTVMSAVISPDIDYGWGSGVYSELNVRPTFYLKASVKYSGGLGTNTNPYRLSI